MEGYVERRMETEKDEKAGGKELNTREREIRGRDGNRGRGKL